MCVLIFPRHSHYVICVKENPVHIYHGGSFHECWDWLLTVDRSIANVDGIAVVSAEELENINNPTETDHANHPACGD